MNVEELFTTLRERFAVNAATGTVMARGSDGSLTSCEEQYANKANPFYGDDNRPYKCTLPSGMVIPAAHVVWAMCCPVRAWSLPDKVLHINYNSRDNAPHNLYAVWHITEHTDMLGVFRVPALTVMQEAMWKTSPLIAEAIEKTPAASRIYEVTDKEFADGKRMLHTCLLRKNEPYSVANVYIDKFASMMAALEDGNLEKAQKLNPIFLTMGAAKLAGAALQGRKLQLAIDQDFWRNH